MDRRETTAPSPAPSSRGGRVVATYAYESGPPANLNNQDKLSTTKTEEWTTKKKKDVLVTKQIETRVKREILVTDDGQILEDSGPTVTTDTTEQTKTEEQETTEHKASGGESPGPGWKLVPGATVVSETKKTNSNNHESREEKHDVEETEEIGGFKRDDIFRALKYKERAAIKRRDSSSTDSKFRDQGSRSSGGGGSSGRNHNVIQQTSRTVVDSQETNEVSDFKDGEVTTETRKTSHREEYLGDDVPDGIVGHSRNPIMTETHSTATLTRRPRAVTDGEAPVTWERVPLDANEKWESVSERMLRQKREQSSRRPEPAAERYDAVDKRSVDIEEEEETRKSETNRWIEDHFGSQDLEDSGLTRSVSTSTLSHLQDSEGKVRADVADTLKKTHYLKRQQVPQGKFRKGPAPQPPPPPPPPVSNHQPTPRTNGHTTSTLPKKQYYLGEDPGIGERFTGMTYKHSLRPIYKSESLRDISTFRNGYVGPSTPPLTPINPPVYSSTPKFATLGRDERVSSNSHGKQPAVRTGSLPSEANGNGTTSRRYHVDVEQHQKTPSSTKVYHQTSESSNLKSYTTLPRATKAPEATTHNGNSHHVEKEKLPKASILKTSHRKSPVPPSGTPPSVSAIINSFRSKEFLERENSIITMRDDESVADNRFSGFSSRPTVLKTTHEYVEPVNTPRSVHSPVNSLRNTNSPSLSSPVNTLRNHHHAYNKNNVSGTSSRKQHVIKISIRSDDSDYGTPVNSPKINGNGNFPLTSSQNSPQNSERDRSYNDSIVKNAINSLLRNKPTNANVSNSYQDYSYSSLSRSNKSSGSNLGGSRTWLTVSTPNVNKLENIQVHHGRKTRKSSQGEEQSYNQANNMNRSQSIGSLNRRGFPASYDEEYSYGSSSGESPLPSNHYPINTRNPGKSSTKQRDLEGGLNHQTKRKHQLMQRLLEHENNEGRQYYESSTKERNGAWRNGNGVATTGVYSSSSPSPPTSPVHGHRIKLPSSIPPPVRPSRSPPPPLTRPYSPSNYYDDYNSNKVSSRVVLGNSGGYSVNSSPSPPATLHSRRPPSPIPPTRDHSVGNDEYNGHVSVTKVTSGSSRGSDASSSIPERVEVVSKKKVTTTTVKRKEVDHPDRYQPPVRVNTRN